MKIIRHCLILLQLTCITALRTPSIFHASSFTLKISLPHVSTSRIILRLSSSELPSTPNKIVFEAPTSKEDDEDYILEQQMALEQYNELKFNDAAGELLRTQTFLEWEEIQDVLENGIIDMETMEIILKESGVTSSYMTFSQFQDCVELVNQVSMAIEEGEDGAPLEGWDDLIEAEADDLAVESDTDQQLQWMLAAMGVKKNPLKE